MPAPANAEGWRFCAACGAPLAGAACARCSTPLSPGSRFCHRCGAPATPGAGQTRERNAADLAPWMVAGIALLALAAVVGVRVFDRDQGGTPAGAGTIQPGMSAAQPGARAVTDISQLTPEERADRLYNRVMMLASEGKTDSVAFFAPMAMQAYQMLGPLNDDQHYDAGRVAAIAGDERVARAHADSILARSPNHLLGLLLAINAADLRGDAAAAGGYRRRLLAAEQAETGRNLPEYERHRQEIAAAVAAARSSRP